MGSCGALATLILDRFIDAPWSDFFAKYRKEPELVSPNRRRKWWHGGPTARLITAARAWSQLSFARDAPPSRLVAPVKQLVEPSELRRIGDRQRRSSTTGKEKS